MSGRNHVNEIMDVRTRGPCRDLVRLSPAAPRLVVRSAGGWVVVGFEGAEELTDEADVAALGAELFRLAGRGRRGLVVDMAGVRYVSSSWLAQLVWLYRRVTDGGGAFRLCSPDPTFRRILAVCCLERVFEVYETEEAAVAAPAPPRDEAFPDA